VKILFDQGTPVPLRKYLTDHQVSTAFEKGWSNLRNGELLQKAEHERFDILVTTDQNLRYQQNLHQRKIALVVLRSTSWPKIQRNILQVVSAIDMAQENDYLEIEIRT
jgi:predicted nuclease of predicted toxin-antitoxin system